MPREAYTIHIGDDGVPKVIDWTPKTDYGTQRANIVRNQKLPKGVVRAVFFSGQPEKQIDALRQAQFEKHVATMEEFRARRANEVNEQQRKLRELQEKAQAEAKALRDKLEKERIETMKAAKKTEIAESSKNAADSAKETLAVQEKQKEAAAAARKLKVTGVAAILGALFLGSIAVQAQELRYAGPITVTCPSVIAAATTTNIAQWIDCRKSANVAVNVKFNFTDAGSDLLVLTFARGLNTSYADTVPTFTMSVPGNGATTVSMTTNLAIGAVGWLKLASVQNAHATIPASNIVIRVAQKLGAP